MPEDVENATTDDSLEDRITEGDGTVAQAADCVDTEITLGRQGKKCNVRKVPLHPLAVKDIYLIGEEKTKTKKLVASRKCKKEQEERERKALQDDLMGELMTLSREQVGVQTIIVTKYTGPLRERTRLSNKIEDYLHSIQSTSNT